MNYSLYEGVVLSVQEYKGAVHQAHLETVMSASGNSSSCIEQQTCQPLGGHSIWGAAPPFPPSPLSASSQMPIIMLLAPVDSDSFFRSATVVSVKTSHRLFHTMQQSFKHIGIIAGSNS